MVTKFPATTVAMHIAESYKVTVYLLHASPRKNIPIDHPVPNILLWKHTYK